MLKNYLKIQQALAADSMEGVAKAAQEIQKDAEGALQAAAAAIAADQGIAQAREHFKAMAAPMDAWARKSRPPGISRVSCPMAKASWLQKKGPIRNPYYGKEMLTCGDVLPD